MVTPYYTLSICLKRFARTRLPANSALQSGDAAVNVIVGNTENSVAQFSKLVSLLFIVFHFVVFIVWRPIYKHGDVPTPVEKVGLATLRSPS